MGKSKELREILKKVANWGYYKGVCDCGADEADEAVDVLVVDDAHSAITKLVKEMIDEHYIAGYNACISDFSLEKSTELRKKKTGGIYG
jgi:tRNA A-37 threonylcarbamoyl transferase component Bud32